MTTSHRFFVFTGGPGSGKTTLLSALEGEGFALMPEAGRAVIRDETAMGGSALPWDDRAAFAERMLRFDLANHAAAAAKTGPVLFDRGVPDTLGYLRLCGLPVPAETIRFARQTRYARTVFLAPFWPEIFTQDRERRQDLAEAEATARTMRRVYGELGYDIAELPRAPVSERVRFVREAIRASL